MSKKIKSVSFGLAHGTTTIDPITTVENQEISEYNIDEIKKLVNDNHFIKISNSKYDSIVNTSQIVRVTVKY